MANEYFVNSADLTSVADAIRTKGETTEQLIFPDGFVTAIDGIKGGAELNFKVVGGTTRPSDPVENTIWVNTPNEITGWGFGAEADKPATPDPGMVWFVTSEDSFIKFDALKDDSIIVTPTAAYQYISGSWKGIADVKIYQNGEWVRWWGGELYTPGNEWTAVTGGWESRVWPPTSTWTGTGTATLTKNTDNMVVTYTGKVNAAVAEPAKDIDLTMYSTLYVDAESSNGAGRVYITQRDGTYIETNKVATHKTIEKTRTTYAIPLSISGTFDIAICAVHGALSTETVTTTIYKMWLE